MEPGEGLHQPWVIFSISSINSAPFFGDAESIDTTAILSPRFLCIIHLKGHMAYAANIGIPSSYSLRFYRYSNIGFPISLNLPGFEV